jgi:hypothetical protein
MRENFVPASVSLTQLPNPGSGTGFYYFYIFSRRFYDVKAVFKRIAFWFFVYNRGGQGSKEFPLVAEYIGVVFVCVTYFWSVLECALFLRVYGLPVPGECPAAWLSAWTHI